MKSLAVLLAGSAFALASNAAIVSGGSFSNAMQPTEISQVGSLGLFDSTLGTLTSFSLTFSGKLSTSITLTNNSSGAGLAQGDTTVDLFMTSSIAALNGIISNPVVSLAGSTGLQNLAAGQTLTFGPLTANGGTTLTSSLAGVLAALSQSGGGNFTLDCSSISGFAGKGANGNLASSQTTEAACGADIAYTYTERTTQVPEPGALALVGIALVGLAMARRKA